MLMVKIYGIINPVNNQMLYIGASVRPTERFKAHVSGKSWDSASYNYKQVLKLKKQGLQPELIILDEVEPEEVRFYEEFYIQLFTSWGFKLHQTKKSGYRAPMIRYLKDEIIFIPRVNKKGSVIEYRNSYVNILIDGHSEYFYHKEIQRINE